MPTSMTDLIARVRAEIGDPPSPFRTSALGDGQTLWFDLPKQQIQSITAAEIINGANITTLADASAATAWLSTTAYTTGTYVTYNNAYYQAAQASTNQTPPSSGNNSYWNNVTATIYTINDTIGQIILGQAVPNNATIIIVGQSWSMFSDIELTTYITDSLNQHCFNRTIKERFRDLRGFIDYRETPLNLTNLPPIEVPLVAILATINVFWTLANDTATDFNISTSEGTHIDRTSQYNQIQRQIQMLDARYQDLCGQLNVGIYRTETLQLRRTSHTTGRLVPVFTPQEIDDHHWPVRQITPIDRRNEDNSGIPTPYWAGPYGP
jgi:hypothetical protein